MAGLSSEEAVEVRANFVAFALLEVVALCATSLPIVVRSKIETRAMGVRTLKRLAPFLVSPK